MSRVSQWECFINVNLVGGIVVKEISRLIVDNDVLLTEQKGLKQAVSQFLRNTRDAGFVRCVLHECTQLADEDVATYQLCLYDSSVIRKSDFASKSLEEIEIPEICDVETGAFRDCFSLKRAAIRSEIVVGEQFRNCESLEEIELFKSVEIIGPDAFADCVKLGKIVYDGVVYTDLDKLMKVLKSQSVTVMSGAFNGTAIEKNNRKAATKKRLTGMYISSDGEMVVKVDWVPGVVKAIIAYDGSEESIVLKSKELKTAEFESSDDVFRFVMKQRYSGEKATFTKIR